MVGLKNLIWQTFTAIKRWFAYWKVCFNIVDWDNSAVLHVEKFQLQRLRAYIDKHGTLENAEHNLERIDIALKLLDIILEDGCSKAIKSELNSSYVWVIPMYVNTKNANRFFPPQNYNHEYLGGLFKDALRLEKAWYLYHKLRLYYLRNFWD